MINIIHLYSLRTQFLHGYFSAISLLGCALRISIIEEVNKVGLNKGRCCTAMQSYHVSAILNGPL